MLNMLKTKTSAIEMLKKIVCGMLKLLWDSKIPFPQKKTVILEYIFICKVFFLSRTFSVMP